MDTLNLAYEKALPFESDSIFAYQTDDIEDEVFERAIAASKPKTVKPKRPAGTSAELSLFERYTKVPNCVLFDKALSLAERVVYLALLAYDFDEKGHSYYSEENMADHLGLSPRQYRRHLTALRDKGYITVKRRGDGETMLTYPKIRVVNNKIVKD